MTFSQRGVDNNKNDSQYFNYLNRAYYFQLRIVKLRDFTKAIHIHLVCRRAVRKSLRYGWGFIVVITLAAS